MSATTFWHQNPLPGTKTRLLAPQKRHGHFGTTDWFCFFIKSLVGQVWQFIRHLVVFVQGPSQEADGAGSQNHYRRPKAFLCFEFSILEGDYSTVGQGETISILSWFKALSLHTGLWVLQAVGDEGHTPSGICMTHTRGREPRGSSLLYQMSWFPPT